MSLRRFPWTLVPDVPESPVEAIRAGQAVTLTLNGRRSATTTREAIVRLARAIATGAWS